MARASRTRHTRIYAPAGFFFTAGFFAAGFFFVAVVFFTAGFFAAGFFAAGFFAAGFFAADFFAGALATMVRECVGGFGGWRTSLSVNEHGSGVSGAVC